MTIVVLVAGGNVPFEGHDAEGRRHEKELPMCKDVVRGCVDEAEGEGWVPPLDVDREQLGDGLSGFVIVRLSRELPLDKQADLRGVAEELKLGALGELLDSLGKPPTRRLITSVEPEKLLGMEREAAQSPFRPLSSLTKYWRVDVRLRHEPIVELAKRFSGLLGVELAYAEQIVSDPVVNPGDDPFNTQQGYLDAAPTGIDARWAWTQAGGEGQGVGVVDLEQGWRLGHQDYAAKAPSLIFNANRDGVGTYVGNHGTAVLGIVGADDNTRGVVGIAPSLASLRVTSHFDGATTLHVADAIVAALPTMLTGHILLLEVQRGAALLPTETDLADFDAIRLATARGIIVVAAAGNCEVASGTCWAHPAQVRRGLPGFQRRFAPASRGSKSHRHLLPLLRATRSEHRWQPIASVDRCTLQRPRTQFDPLFRAPRVSTHDGVQFP